MTKAQANNTLFYRLFKAWGLVGLLLIWFVILLWPQGPGITFDSVSFLQIGHHLLADGNYVHTGPNGLEFAAERFPLYIWLLVPFMQSKLTLFALQLLLYLGSLISFKKLLQKQGVSPHYLMFFGFYVFIANYYSIWTESLYGLILLAIISLIDETPVRKTIRLLALLIVLLCLTRLVGVVVAGSLGLAYVVKRRSRVGFLIIAAAVITILVWVLYGKLFHDSQARFIQYNAITATNWLAMPKSISQILLTPHLNSIVALIIGCCISVLPGIYLLAKKVKQLEITVMDWFLTLHFYGYILFIWVCIAFIDACIPVEFRTLFPIYINLVVLFIVFLKSDLIAPKPKSKLNFVAIKLILALLIINGYLLFNFSQKGTGYNSAYWDDFKFTTNIAQTDAPIVYTNDQAAVNYFSNYRLNLKLLHEKYNLHSLIVNDNYTQMHNQMIRDIQTNPAAKIIWVRNGITENIYPTYQELKDDHRLQVIYDDWTCLILTGNQ